MPQSHVYFMNDPALYRSALRAGDAEMMVTGSGQYRAELVRIDLHKLWMQQSSDRLPRIIHCSHDPRRAGILFLSHGEQASLQHDGAEFGPGEIAFYRTAASSHHRTTSACRFGTMSLTPDDLAASAKALIGRELTPPEQTRFIRPAPEAMSRLTTLHGRVAQLARETPGALSHPATARSLEQALIHAMISCLTEDKSTTRAAGRRASIMARFEEFLQSRQYAPVYLAEICAAVGVPERTLRACCQDHLGMGPIHYLWLRRMHLAHKALLCSDARAATVTEIATQHGFWELGRFSVEYRSLFGEPPSASLHRSSH